MKILITGDEGFIATYLYDALSTKYPDASIVGFDQADYFSGAYLIYQKTKFDYIFHLGAIARTAECTEDPYNRSFESNVMLTRHLLKNFKFKKFIYASSCALYGSQTVFPIAENNPLNVPSVYAAQKLFSENLIHMSLTERKIPSVCLRLFNTYGPKQSMLGSYPNVLASMIRTYKTSGYVEVTGDGLQTRNFIYVDDTVNAFIASMQCDGNQIYNVAGPSEISIGELAVLVTRDFQKVRFVPTRPFDIRYQHNVSIEKIRRDLNWNSSIDIKDGVERILKHESIL